MKIRVYYEDTDCGNVVYYANYLKYMERSRTELLREKGISLNEFHEKGIFFIVAEAHVHYSSSAHYDDLLDVESSVEDLGGASIGIKTIIKKQTGDLVVTGFVKLACTSNTGKVLRLPAEIRKKLI